ncbi:hypothetical protein [Nocardioides sp. URHA0032]|uniref:hypothetical protein n=1 Tax=Nocardioides sp. URHA0032 TaxID=1380388 RepID=UPI000B0571EF|nr:hypothetical protein [Nocardioides sp. URHA0032]
MHSERCYEAGRRDARAVARATYVALLYAYHELDPDHCGGECFKSALIDAALDGER